MDKKDKAGKPSDLRQRAEAFLLAHTVPNGEATATPEDALRLLHELHVYQVELEMQNEELRRAERELQASYDRYFSLYDLAPVGYLTLDKQNRIREVNLTLGQMLATQRERLLGQPWPRYVAPPDQRAFEQFAEAVRALDRRQALDITLTRADGNSFPAHLDGVVLETPDDVPLLRISVSDISELRHAVDALRQSEEHFRTLVLHIPDVTWTVDRRGRLTYISPNIERLTGYAAEILNANPGFWEEHVLPEDLDAALQAFKGVPEGGDVYQTEYRFRHRNGELIWIQSRSMRTFEINGQTRTDGILTDVTVRKRIEEYLRQTATDLERQALERTTEVKRLEHQRDAMTEDVAAGKRAATVIHEINNPLAGILNSFRLIRKGISPDHPHYHFLDLINRELERVAQLVRQMYGYGSVDTHASARCHPRRVLDEVIEVMASVVQARQIKVFVHEDSESLVRMSESDLKQILYNLYSNAIKASHDGSEIHFRLRRADSLFRITVEDQGTGIPAEKLPHIFESFTGGVAVQPRTGMHVGLYTVKTLLEAVQGRVEVQTREGSGTTMTLLIPVADTEEGNP